MLVLHDARWSKEFERESAAVATALGDALVEIHHIGSTAIPGIWAKPVIDMLVVVTDLGLLDGRTHPAEAQRYSELKLALAQSHPSDIDSYTDGKSSFVREIEARALPGSRAGQGAR